ncbi:MAG: hypothetical protein SGCHY_000930 [Lobulomycetales sp.]
MEAHLGWYQDQVDLLGAQVGKAEAALRLLDHEESCLLSALVFHSNRARLLVTAEENGTDSGLTAEFKQLCGSALFLFPATLAPADRAASPAIRPFDESVKVPRHVPEAVADTDDKPKDNESQAAGRFVEFSKASPQEQFVYLTGRLDRSLLELETLENEIEQQEKYLTETELRGCMDLFNDQSASNKRFNDQSE